jgi:alkanesulfonate monooxygenase
MVLQPVTPFLGIRTPDPVCEMAWFADLCGGDTTMIGVPDPDRRSSFEHCREIVLTAEKQGFLNILLPTSYMIGQEVIPFAAAVAPSTSTISLLPAIRLGEVHPPTLARTVSTLDHLLQGRLSLNIISSDLPGLREEGGYRYRRTSEIIRILRSAWAEGRIKSDGELYQFDLPGAPVRPYQRSGPLLYFGGLSEVAREVAAWLCDVYLLWPLPEEELAAVIADVSARAARYGRKIDFGLRIHVVVRETRKEAREWATFLARGLDEAKRINLKGRTQDATSAGVAAQQSLRAMADGDGYAEEVLWTTIGEVRSGASSAIVGSPAEVLEKLERYRALGFRSFILSGYPLREESLQVGKLVLPELPNRRLSEVQGRFPHGIPETPLTFGPLSYD